MSFNFLKNDIIYEDLESLYQQKIDWEKLRNKKVMITGAYGMLAAYLVYMLIFLNEKYKFNIQIWVLVRNNSKLKERFGIYVEKEYFHCLIHELDTTIRMEEKVDYIIHAASLASPQFYEMIPIEVIKPNVLGTFQLLEYAKQCKVENFLFFSSSEIYGKQSESVRKNYDENTIGVIDPMEVRNCYSEAKRMGENLCVSYSAEYGIPTNSVRIFHTYGSTMDVKNDQRAFSEFVLNVLENKNIEMKSEGLAKRPFCYISDATAAFFLILLHGEIGATYNMCAEENYISIGEFAEIMAGLYPEKGLCVKKVIREAGSSYSEKRDENQITADSSKLRDLGWKVQVSVREGAKRTIEGIIKNAGI